MRIGSLVVALMVLVSACGVVSPGVDSLMAAAKENRAAGRHRAAAIQLSNVLQKNPTHAEALYLLGLEYYGIRDFKSAATMFTRALNEHFDATKVVRPLCKSLLAVGDLQQALDQTNIEAGGDIGLQAELLALKGMALVGLGRAHEGEDLLTRALETQRDQVDALIGKAQLAEAAGRLDDASNLLERAVAASPRDIDALTVKADLQRYRKQAGAVGTYRNVLELDPENLPARLSLVWFYVDAGDLDAARKELALAKVHDPAAPMVKYSEGLIEFRSGNYAAAQAAVREVLMVAQEHTPSLLLAGGAAYALGSYAESQILLLRAINNAPDNMRLRKLLAVSFAKGGNPRRALDALSRVLAANPNDASVLGLAGEFALQDGNPVVARDYFEKAVKAAPASADARTGLAASRLAWGETERALSDLEIAVRLEPQRSEADVLLVLTYLQGKRFDQALKAARALAQKQPTNPTAQNLLGAAYLGVGNLPGARKALETALEHQPTYAPAAINLAHIDLREGQQPSARRRLELVLEKDENNLQALLALADMAPSLGASAKEQREWLERAVKAAPDMARAKIMLARRLAQDGESTKALELARELRNASPGSPEVLELVGSLELTAGNSGNALGAFERLVAAQPKSSIARYRLGMAQVAAGNNAGAAKSLGEAVSLQPDNFDAMSVLASLEFRSGKRAEAMQLARQLQKQATRSSIGYLLEGDMLMTENKFSQAAKVYDSGYEIQKNGPLAVRVHSAYAEAGKPDVAEARLARWLSIAPDDVTARLYLADFKLKKELYADAIEQYEWLQRRLPESVTVLNNLALTYQRAKDPRALPTAERAYKLQPGNGSVADTLGWILVEEGRFSQGVELLRVAVAASSSQAAAPDTLEMRFHLAEGLYKAGERSKAQTELEVALKTGTPFRSRTAAASLLAKIRAERE